MSVSSNCLVHTDSVIVGQVRQRCHQYPTATFSEIIDLCGHYSPNPIVHGYVPALIQFRWYLVAINEYTKTRYNMAIPNSPNTIPVEQQVYLASRYLVEKFTQSTFWDAYRNCPVYRVQVNKLADKVFNIATIAIGSIYATPELNQAFELYIKQYQTMKPKT
jgi:hypothetical protein